MQSRTTHSLVSLALLTAIACAHQQDPEDIFQDTDNGPGTGGTTTTAGTGSKAGSVSVGSGGAGSTTSKGGSSALPTGKAGSKATGGAGGSSTAGTDAGGTGGGGGSGTVNMPVEGMSVTFKAQSTDETVDFVGGELHVINDAAQPFTLSDLKIRYYITNEVTDVSPGFIWQWGQFGPSNQLGNVMCTGVVTPMGTPKAGADTYIEFTCSTDGILEAGTKLVMSWKVGAQGMGKMVQTDDWSFAATQADNDKIVVLDGNTVVWGIEP